MIHIRGATTLDKDYGEGVCNIARAHSSLAASLPAWNSVLRAIRPAFSTLDPDLRCTFELSQRLGYNAMYARTNRLSEPLNPKKLICCSNDVLQQVQFRYVLAFDREYPPLYRRPSTLASHSPNSRGKRCFDGQDVQQVLAALSVATVRNLSHPYPGLSGEYDRTTTSTYDLSRICRWDKSSFEDVQDTPAAHGPAALRRGSRAPAG